MFFHLLLLLQSLNPGLFNTQDLLALVPRRSTLLVSKIMCSKHLLSRFRNISADFWVRKYNFDQPVQWQDSNNSFLKEKL